MERSLRGASSPTSSSSRAQTVLLISRAPGRSCPAGSNKPSAYSAGAVLSSCAPASPQDGCSGLLLPPSNSRKSLILPRERAASRTSPSTVGGADEDGEVVVAAAA